MNSQCRATILSLTVLFVASVSATDQTNIVFILADDVGCEPLGCYGGTSYETPNIDALARSGIQFSQCYSMPVCHPSRIALLTGRYPLRIGNPQWGTFPRSLEKHTLAHQMKKAGYATVVAGKWQLTLLGKEPDHPRRLGFDESCLFGWHEGPRYHDPMIWQNGKLRDDTKGAYGPDLYVDFLIDFFERNQSKPFFAFYSMALCHDVTDDLKEPVPYSTGKDRYDNYPEMMATMDRCVGRVVAGLDRLGLREKTLIVFTGDNGTAKRSIIRAEQNDSGKFMYIKEPVTSNLGGKSIPGGKGNLTDDGTRVPLIAAWPAMTQSKQTVDDLVDFSDFLPTFSRLVDPDANLPPEIDGLSFANRLFGKGSGPRAWAFSQGKKRFWLRTQRWKLYSDGRFYDVLNDPTEKKPINTQALPADARQVYESLTQTRKKFAASL